MTEHVVLVGGPEAGRKLTIVKQHTVLNVDVRDRRPDLSRPRRRGRSTRRTAAYRRSEIGVGTALIRRRYVFAGERHAGCGEGD